jgi:hypothetical protein
LEKLSIVEIVGKMPIIHSFEKAFNWQNCRENANHPLVWKSFQLAKLWGKCQLSIRLEKFSIGKIVGKMPFSICLGKSSIGKLKGKCHPSHKLYPCDTRNFV